MTGKFKILKILGLCIFIFILFNVDFSELLAIWNDSDLYFIIFGGLSIILLHIIHAIKWKFIMQFLSLQNNLIESIKISWVGMFLGMITPGKLGDILKIYFLDEDNNSTSRAFLSVLIDRISDMAFLVVMGIISGFVLYKWKLSIMQYISIPILVSISLIIIVRFKNNIFLVVQKFLNKYFPFILKIFEGFSFIQRWRDINKGITLIVFLLLLLKWFLYFASRFLLLISLGISLSFFDMAACVTLSTLFSLLPVSFNGIGTRDVSMIYLFSLFGLKAEQAVSFSMLILFIDVMVISFGYIPYFRLCHRFRFNLKRDASRIKESFIGSF